MWIDHFIANLTSNYGVSESDLNALKAASTSFRAKTAHATDAAALAKQATADKNDSHYSAETLIRALVRRIKRVPAIPEARARILASKGLNTHMISPLPVLI